MKTYLNIFFLSLILCTACGNRKVSDSQTEDIKSDSTKIFALPVIPAMLTTPELRADYLVRHYWENMDFADTTCLDHREMMEQAWVDYIDIMKLVPEETAISAIKQMYKDAGKKKKVFFYFTDLAEKYLYDPNSPMRNEELYIPVLDAMLESTVLDDTEKILPKGRRELAEQNRLGRQAEDFTYTLVSGKSGTLYGVKAMRQCLEDVASLEAAGKLWAPDVYKDMAFDFKNRQTVVKALCLHVAHTCNLNCSYCFASQGRYQGDRALMSFEVGKRAMDFLIENSGTRRNLEVDFFGGEPLMNFDMVKKLVAYCREQEKIHNKNFRFTMTTNGMLIDDDVIDFCNKECHNVVLSLDGRKEVHDRFRKDYAGHGSYDAIVPKFQEFVKKRGDKNYYMRGTYTHYNTDFTNDIFHMADLGFTELSMEPVVTKPTDPSALTAEDLPILKEQYEILAKEMIKRDREGRGFTFYHYITMLSGGFPPAIGFRWCA